MRDALAMMALVLTGACSDPETSFGDPGAVLQRRLPNEEITSGFSGSYSPTTNPPPPTRSLRAGHQNVGPPVPDVGTAADVLDCLSCHGEGNAGATIKWAFGGRVIANGKAAANVDVVVVNPDNSKIGPTKSDADGFFWVPSGAGTIAQGAAAMARNDKGAETMSEKLKEREGSCDKAQCHVASGGAGKIHVR